MGGRRRAKRAGESLILSRGWALYRMDIFAIQGTGGLWAVTLGPLAWHLRTPYEFDCLSHLPTYLTLFTPDT